MKNISCLAQNPSCEDRYENRECYRGYHEVEDNNVAVASRSDLRWLAGKIMTICKDFSGLYGQILPPIIMVPLTEMLIAVAKVWGDYCEIHYYSLVYK
jgi:hypothetical protein